MKCDPVPASELLNSFIPLSFRVDNASVCYSDLHIAGGFYGEELRIE